MEKRRKGVGRKPRQDCYRSGRPAGRQGDAIVPCVVPSVFFPTHLPQNGIYLFLREPVVLPQDIPEAPVRPAMYVVLDLLRKCPLDLLQGNVFADYGDAPEAVHIQCGT